MAAFDGRGRYGRPLSEAVGTRAEPVPGKQTLTAQLPVQRMAEEYAEPSAAGRDEVHAAADHGTSGPAADLPHRATIQQLFGRHDVSRVQAHMDDRAREGSAAMGAHAFARGEHVAFAGTPDLHTVAHEAAHVVQQRGGVQLKGGVGQEGDEYERHADAVADRVVRGESAEALLSQNAGSSSRAGAASVQRGGGPSKLMGARPLATATNHLANKAEHIFGPKALIRHNLAGVLKFFGGNKIRAVQALEAAAEMKVDRTKAGKFETQVDVASEEVTVRGAVVDGEVKLGTAFVSKEES